MKSIQSMLAAYLPMPMALSWAIESGTVRPVSRETGAMVYFIAPDCPDKEPVRRAIAQRRRWELAAVWTLGVVTGIALVGVAHLFAA